MQQAWIDSYDNLKHRKMLFPKGPTGAGNIFLNFLEKNNFSYNKPLLDIGCGNGRNALALSKLGFDVYGFDGIPAAIQEANASIQNDREIAPNMVSEKDRSFYNRFVVGDVGEAWSYNNDQFTYAIDINTFSSVLSPSCDVYIAELARVLQPSGLYFLYTYTNEDEYYYQFARGNDNNGAMTIHCEDDGIDRVLYSPSVLKRMFHDAFDLVYSENVVRYSKMFDTFYKRHFIAMIIQKRAI